MEKINVEDAVGMPLCHDVTAMYPGFKGALFKRGHIITEEDIPVLLNLGKKTVYAGDIGNGLIHEDDCALRLAAMTAAKGVHHEGPSEGKMVLVSDIKGMLLVNIGLLEKINSIGDITITTLPDHYRVEEGTRIASMRIIPLFTEEEKIKKAEGLCAETHLFELLPYKPKKVGVVITGSEIYNGRITDLFEPVVRKKLSYFPGEITHVRICDDDIDMILDSAKMLLSEGADFLVFSGGMSVDPDDLTVGAVKRLGADIISYGIPAQPGNMTLIAYLGDIPVLGIPGAAISRPVTMFDVILPQIYTGLKFTKQDIIKLGNGGLCQMCDKCHFPNCTFGRY